MGEVIAFAPAERDEPEDEAENHLTGPAKCLSCRHEWVAIVPPGETIYDLVCPKCDTRRGQLMYPAELSPDMIYWEHGCGGRHFSVTILDRAGYVAKGAEMAIVNTAGHDRHTTVLLCHGCGEFVDPYGI